MLKTDIKDSPIDPEWSGSAVADFFGRTYTPELVFSAEDDGDYSRQLGAFEALAERWDMVQPDIARIILSYYENELRFSYGPEDEDEMDKMWPEIGSPEQLAGLVNLDCITLPSGEDMDDIYGGDTVFLCFSCEFGDDTDADGIGVRITGCEVAEAGNTDIAF